MNKDLTFSSNNTQSKNANFDDALNKIKGEETIPFSARINRQLRNNFKEKVVCDNNKIYDRTITISSVLTELMEAYLSGEYKLKK